MANKAKKGSPITITVKRSVKEGGVEAYEAALQQMLKEVESFDGYLGAEIQRPAASDPKRVYQSVFRFRDTDSLHAFEKSDLRATFLTAVKDHVASDGEWVINTGLEVWFETPVANTPQPSRIRMALLLIIVVWSLVLSIGILVTSVAGDLWYPLRLLIVITIEVMIMTYILMPWLTKKLYRYLYPQ